MRMPCSYSSVDPTNLKRMNSLKGGSQDTVEQVESAFTFCKSHSETWGNLDNPTSWAQLLHLPAYWLHESQRSLMRRKSTTIRKKLCSVSRSQEGFFTTIDTLSLHLGRSCSHRGRATACSRCHHPGLYFHRAAQSPLMLERTCKQPLLA